MTPVSGVSEVQCRECGVAGRLYRQPEGNVLSGVQLFGPVYFAEGQDHAFAGNLCGVCTQHQIELDAHRKRDAERQAGEKKRSKETRERLAEVPVLFRKAEFGRIQPKIRKAVEGWVEHASLPTMVFCGPPDTGKTWTAWALFIRQVKEGRTAQMHNAVWLADVLKAEAGRFELETTAMLSNYPGLLFIDDLGAGKISDFVESQFYTLFNTRRDWNRKTVVTTNLLSREAMASETGSRVAKRVWSDAVVPFRQTEQLDWLKQIGVR